VCYASQKILVIYIWVQGDYQHNDLFACLISKKRLYSSVEIFEKKGIPKEHPKPQPVIKPGHARKKAKLKLIAAVSP
jgi:hypothetical protein